MNVLEQLQPKAVFSYFEALCGIPHGSGNMGEISRYCVEFARKHGLEYYQDAAHNVIIVKPATAGYEDAPAVMIQGHLDMVCAKEVSLTELDMATTPLELAVEGDYIYAKGTSLGGDDGIAIAYTLAILESQNLQHPRIEAVFTTDEEVGMLGAAAIDLSPLKAKMLLNIDSEEEGIFLASCAGGVTAVCSLPVTLEESRGTVMELSVSGLQGGHSGVQIDKGLGNANMLMGRLLNRLAKRADYQIAALKGGTKDNAIPLLCQATIVTSDPHIVKEVVREYDTILKSELKTSDPGVTVKAAEKTEKKVPALNGDCTKRAVCLLLNVPNGIQSMSMDIKGLVETSLNLGIIALEQNVLRMSFAVRSSVRTAKEAVVERLQNITQALGGTTTLSGDYPAWEYKAESRLRKVVVEAYRDQYGEEPLIQAVHAGLECGILSGKIDDLDCISLGPNMTGAHTCHEKLSISSTIRTWKLIVEVLKRLKDLS